MYWHGRLVIPALQRFYSSQQVARFVKVSISSPSSEGGGNLLEMASSLDNRIVSISSPSSEGGGKRLRLRSYKAPLKSVSISSPSSEGGG